MSTQTISIESLYANGMGIELPISNVKDSSQTQESYDCSNIIDLQSIENDLSYINTYELLEKHNTNDMIKLHNKLNKEYGKHNKSLESYLDTRIHSLEEEKKGNKFIEMIKTAIRKIGEWFVSFGNAIKSVFTKMTMIFRKKEIREIMKAFEANKDKTIETNLILKNFNPDEYLVGHLESLKIIPASIKMAYNAAKSEWSNDEKEHKKFYNSMSEYFYLVLKRIFKKTDVKKGDSFMTDALKYIESLKDDELYNKVSRSIKISDKKEMKLSEIFANGAQFKKIYDKFNQNLETSTKLCSYFKEAGEAGKSYVNNLEKAGEKFNDVHKSFVEMYKLLSLILGKMMNVNKDINEVCLKAFSLINSSEVTIDTIDSKGNVS